MKALKSKLADNDMWDPLVIGSNLSSSHPPHRGEDAKEMRALGASGQRPHGGDGATPESRIGGSAKRWREGTR